MKPRTLILSGLALLGLLAVPSSSLSESIAIVSGTVTTSDPTQNGRLVRNGIQQDWAGTETFPGENNPGVNFHYATYQFAASLFQGAPYVEITFDDPDAVYFISAYDGTYHPGFGQKNINWLGDEGSTGNYFGINPSFFDVVLPAGDNLTLVINDTLAMNGGVGAPFTFTVDAFGDTSYDPPSAVPEPSSLLLLGTGIVGAATTLRRRLR